MTTRKRGIWFKGGPFGGCAVDFSTPVHMCCNAVNLSSAVTAFSHCNDSRIELLWCIYIRIICGSNEIFSMRSSEYFQMYMYVSGSASVLNYVVVFREGVPPVSSSINASTFVFCYFDLTFSNFHLKRSPYETPNFRENNQFVTLKFARSIRRFFLTYLGLCSDIFEI